MCGLSLGHKVGLYSANKGSLWGISVDRPSCAPRRIIQINLGKGRFNPTKPIVGKRVRALAVAANFRASLLFTAYLLKKLGLTKKNRSALYLVSAPITLACSLLLS